MTSDSRMRIAVTGGSGRVGRKVVEHLCAQGHSVINIDHRYHANSPARFVYMDVRRRELLQPVLEQVDAVIHLGEIPSVGILPNDETYAHNAAAGATVLQTAADLKLRHVIYTSTCQVYGAWGSPTVPPLRLPVDEEHPPQPQNAYGLSKAANEAFCRMVARDTGLRVSIFRLPWVVTQEYDERLHRWIERHAVEMSGVDGFGTYIHAGDVARAYEMALQRNLEGCRTYVLAAQDTVRQRPVREMLEATAPHYPKLPADWPTMAPPVSTERARRDLGWEPQWSLWAEQQRFLLQQGVTGAGSAD